MVATNVLALIISLAANKLEQHRIQLKMLGDAGQSDSSGNLSPVEFETMSLASPFACNANLARSRWGAAVVGAGRMMAREPDLVGVMVVEDSRRNT